VLYNCSGSSVVQSETLTVPGSQSGGAAARAHSSRVLALEWHPQDSNVLFSGGWDLTVKVLLTFEQAVLHGRSPVLCFVYETPEMARARSAVLYLEAEPQTN
jgi:WD40 repeat protein